MLEQVTGDRSCRQHELRQTILPYEGLAGADMTLSSERCWPASSNSMSRGCRRDTTG